MKAKPLQRLHSHTQTEDLMLIVLNIEVTVIRGLVNCGKVEKNPRYFIAISFRLQMMK